MTTPNLVEIILHLSHDGLKKFAFIEWLIYQTKVTYTFWPSQPIGQTVVFIYLKTDSADAVRLKLIYDNT